MMYQDKVSNLVEFYQNTNEWSQFRHCQAWVSGHIFCSAYSKHFRLMKSYNTIVAFIDCDTREFISLGKWSRTTSKQTTQIYNAIFREQGYKFVQW